MEVDVVLVVCFCFFFSPPSNDEDNLPNDADEDDNEGNCFLSQGTPGAVVGQLSMPLGSEPATPAAPKVEVEDVVDPRQVTVLKLVVEAVV